MSNENEEKIGCLPYVLAGLSFIPLIGVIFGLIVIVIGFLKIRTGGWKLIMLGVLGISTTVLLYGTLFYQASKDDGMFAGLHDKLAEKQLTDLVKNIEYYKIQHSKYPASLLDLQPKDPADLSNAVFIYDSTNSFNLKDNDQPKLFYYELFNDHNNYYLFSSGKDGMPFTSDDIHPLVNESEQQNIGYRRK
ncbi:MAG: type II secretion system protein G [Pseudomonadales bacterium]|nr:type II secretion system protein G [Pseudomonadales bacterium]